MTDLATSLFVSEYICSGALAGDELPASLAAEGAAMLAAAVKDVAALPDVEVTTTLDRRLSWASRRAGERRSEKINPLPHSLTRSLAPSARVIEVSDPSEEVACFQRLARQCDATLVIAPEFDRILYERTRWVEESGGRLLGSSSQAVAVASDKYRTNRLLAERGVPATQGTPLSLASGQEVSSDQRSTVSKTGPTPTLKPQRSALNSQYPAVLKPRFGAGSQCTYLIKSACDMARILDQAVREGIGEHGVLEPYVAGPPASVAVLIGRFGAVPLPVASQNLSADGRFRYLGGSVPLGGTSARLAQETALRAVACVAGLQGYVGVDLILGNHGEPATVVEINPRLTTSYVALRKAVQQNLMALIVRDPAARPKLDITGDRVDFTSDGEWVSGRVSE